MNALLEVFVTFSGTFSRTFFFGGFGTLFFEMLVISTFFFIGRLSGKAKTDFPTTGDFEPTKKPKKKFAPAAQLENKFISFVVQKIAFCGLKILVGRPSGRPPAPDSPTKKNVRYLEGPEQIPKIKSVIFPSR